MNCISKKAKLTEVPKIGELLKKFGAPSLIDESISNLDKSNTFLGQDFEKRSGAIIQEKHALLMHQGGLKIEYAIIDAQSIINGEKLDFGCLSPHFGNGNKVNEVIKDPSISDSASAIANVAQLMVLLSKDDMQVMKERILPALNGCDSLFKFFKNYKMSEAIASNVLIDYVESVKMTLKDVSNGKVSQEIVDEYIKNRFFEVATNLKEK